MAAFTDVASSQFRAEIEWLATTGISTGYPDGTFRPAGLINRDAMAAFLYRFAVRFAGEPEWSVPGGPSPFKDVATDTMFYREITWLSAHEITTGYPDGTFRPLTPVNRDAMAAFLHRIAVKLMHEPAWTPPATSPFIDVAPNNQFYADITWLRSTRITTGYEGGTYRPLTPVSREAMAAFLFRFAHPAPKYDVSRVSVSNNNVQGNYWSDYSTVSADGNYVVFASEASNLVAGDTNGVADVFRRDLKSGVTTLVSVSTAGAKADEWSDEPVVSADGRYVAFVSYGSNLVAGDTNEVGDVFLRDMTAGVTTRLSVSSSGAQATGDSGYMSGLATLSMSDDGRYVAFGSDASNLVAGDTNGAWDLFVRDTQNNTTTRVSVSTGSGQADNMSAEPALTADGTHIAFSSIASNLVAGDTNDVPDVFVRDLVTSVTTRVSVGASSAQGTEESSEAAISADGRYVAFSSFAPNLVAGDTNKDWDVFVRDTQTATTTRVSVATSGAQANSGSGEVAMSANGRYIVFTTAASNLFAGDFNQSLDVVVRDLTAGSTGLVSARLDGTQAEYESFLGSISADGAVISFTSYASNLVAGDTNEDSDVFVARKQ